jgi:hypothetical protein
MSDVSVIEKHSRASRLNGYLQRSYDIRTACPGRQVHDNSHGLRLPGFNHDSLHEIVVSGLAHCDLVFTWQQEHLLVSL